jgi:hypothetical protein
VLFHFLLVDDFSVRARSLTRTWSGQYLLHHTVSVFVIYKLARYPKEKWMFLDQDIGYDQKSRSIGEPMYQIFHERDAGS